MWILCSQGSVLPKNKKSRCLSCYLFHCQCLWLLNTRRNGNEACHQKHFRMVKWKRNRNSSQKSTAPPLWGYSFLPLRVEVAFQTACPKSGSYKLNWRPWTLSCERGVTASSFFGNTQLCLLSIPSPSISYTYWNLKSK